MLSKNFAIHALKDARPWKPIKCRVEVKVLMHWHSVWHAVFKSKVESVFLYNIMIQCSEVQFSSVYKSVVMYNRLMQCSQFDAVLLREQWLFSEVWFTAEHSYTSSGTISLHCTAVQ